MVQDDSRTVERPEPWSACDETLLDAAIEVVSARGYLGATTRRIAAKAGVNEVTLFRRFGSKQALISKAVMREANRLVADAVDGNEIGADLLAFCRSYQRVVTDRAPFIAVLISEVPRHPELREVLNGPLGAFRAVSRIISRGQETGQLRREPPMAATITLLAPLLAHTFLGRAVGDGIVPALDLEEHVRGFLRGRAPDPSTSEDS